MQSDHRKVNERGANSSGEQRRTAEKTGGREMLLSCCCWKEKERGKEEAQRKIFYPIFAVTLSMWSSMGLDARNMRSAFQKANNIRARALPVPANAPRSTRSAAWSPRVLTSQCGQAPKLNPVFLLTRASRRDEISQFNGEHETFNNSNQRPASYRTRAP